MASARDAVKPNLSFGFGYLGDGKKMFMSLTGRSAIFAVVLDWRSEDISA